MNFIQINLKKVYDIGAGASLVRTFFKQKVVKDLTFSNFKVVDIMVSRFLM
jgi:hypothetical protein